MEEQLPDEQPKKGRGRGRPRVVIDWPRVDAMCKAMGKSTDIAAALGISDDALQDAVMREKKVTFSEYRAFHVASTRHILRQTQLKVAIGYEFEEIEEEYGKNNVMYRRVIHKKKREPSGSMLIWLGKNELGQSDKVNIAHEISDFQILGDAPDGVDPNDIVE